MTDHPRLTRYTPGLLDKTFTGMLKERGPGFYGPEYDYTHGPYVLAAEADAEIARLRTEVERLTRDLGRYAYPPDHRVSVAEAERDQANALEKERDTARKERDVVVAALPSIEELRIAVAKAATAAGFEVR